MLGNVWEWTASDFTDPTRASSPIMYADYSEPWFGDGFKALRGGCVLRREAD